MKRKQFNREFKLEAVRLLKQRGKPVTERARELDVPRSKLYRWQQEIEKKGEAKAFRGSGRPPGQSPLSELDRLRKRVAELEEENTVLKKAGAYFADHHE
ncbi:MAG: transposase [Halieaceae bacterium]|jgi:transposase|nr:transposase [Halieaceae bacterium]